MVALFRAVRWAVLAACSVSLAFAEKELASEEELFEGPEYSQAFKNPKDHPGRPNVLLIGDSISNAYTVDVRKLLHGKADVFRIPGNGKNSAYGLEHLDKWLAMEPGKWDVIHFNWGLWDLCYRHPESKTQGYRDKVNGTITATPEQYRSNMEKIVARLKRTDATLIWCATTPVPEFEAGRKLGDDLVYNEIAGEIMEANGIRINDLHSHALQRYAKIQRQKGDVHYTPEGSAYLAEKVASEISAALRASGGSSKAGDLPVRDWLLLDLDANRGVELEDGLRVAAWRNQVEGTAADRFVKRDEGRELPGSGRPTLKRAVARIGGNDTLVFEEQELVNLHEDAFDHLVTGSGYTWFSVMCAYEQNVGKKDVNSFFGNLKNGSFYEGFWGNLMDDNRVWMGTRNGIRGEGKPTLWHERLNPLVVSEKPLEQDRYYIVMGRMDEGHELVDLELFVNSSVPVDTKQVPVNPEANPSKMAIGQERDATNHPGKESFSGEIARLLIYERPLADEEMEELIRHLAETYSIKLDS
ncbi:SGNH/GDSL hydrolase family protein [Pelagicoccus sp. SDUM812005]|uniref:SGNH/GDSL hydrolase family protein n=1 Tax=Pelagicoccus sp. SDUM812005 TaxID=3041257 RepID=UPI00280FC78E|nr:SGNH/GDSL hydrolase family protein [Pelagicoccus sp. SDUM812005]MDQ8180288.1 SGNH/GDSL hydrolase family protein [Pelagicoccus sp. SDUM812005]